MRLRTAIEAVILVIFIAIASVVVLRRNIPADAGSAMGASGDQLYAAGGSKYSAAAVRYWEAIEQNPNMADARFKIASIYYFNGWNYESLRELSEVERINPEYPGLHLLLGKLYRATEEADKEFAALQQAAAEQPENPEVHYLLGLVYERKSMAREAINEYEQATNREPSHLNSATILRAYLQLGRIHKGKQQKKAEEEFKKALSIDPTSAQVISELRTLYRQQAEHYKSKREYDKAAEKYQEILKIDPNNPRNVGIYMELGDRYFYDELYDEAEEMYKAAARLDPVNFDVFSSLKQLEILKNQ